MVTSGTRLRRRTVDDYAVYRPSQGAWYIYNSGKRFIYDLNLDEWRRPVAADTW